MVLRLAERPKDRPRPVLLTKACPRCELGDLILEEDVDGVHYKCLQCGAEIQPPQPPAERR